MTQEEYEEKILILIEQKEELREEITKWKTVAMNWQTKHRELSKRYQDLLSERLDLDFEKRLYRGID